jgi:hypothetical protein
MINILGDASSINTSDSSATGVPRYWPLTFSGRASGCPDIRNEARSCSWIELDGVLSALRITITLNSRATAAVLTVRQNFAATAMSVTVPAGTTGTFTDLTNTVTVTAGDAMSISVPSIEFIKDFIIGAINFKFDTSYSATFQRSTDIYADSVYNRTVGSATVYIPLVGTGNNSSTWANTTEARSISHAMAAGTISRLRINVVTNTATYSSTCTVRKNGVDTSLALTIPASTTGVFVNTADSVSVIAGDTTVLKVASGAGSGNAYMSSVNTLLVLDDDDAFQSGQGSTGVNSFGLTAGGTHYWSIGPNLSVSATDSLQHRLDFDTVLTAIGVYVDVAIGAWTFTSRVNGSAGTVSVSLPGGVSGYFLSAGGGDTVNAGDSVSLSSSAAPANAVFNKLTVLFGPPVGSGGSTGAYLFVIC